MEQRTNQIPGGKRGKKKPNFTVLDTVNAIVEQAIEHPLSDEEKKLAERLKEHVEKFQLAA